jgi:hypothetical protein
MRSSTVWAPALLLLAGGCQLTPGRPRLAGIAHTRPAEVSGKSRKLKADFRALFGRLVVFAADFSVWFLFGGHGPWRATGAQRFAQDGLLGQCGGDVALLDVAEAAHLFR